MEDTQQCQCDRAILGYLSWHLTSQWLPKWKNKWNMFLKRMQTFLRMLRVLGRLSVCVLRDQNATTRQNHKPGNFCLIPFLELYLRPQIGETQSNSGHTDRCIWPSWYVEYQLLSFLTSSEQFSDVYGQRKVMDPRKASPYHTCSVPAFFVPVSPQFIAISCSHSPCWHRLFWIWCVSFLAHSLAFHWNTCYQTSGIGRVIFCLVRNEHLVGVISLVCNALNPVLWVWRSEAFPWGIWSASWYRRLKLATILKAVLWELIKYTSMLEMS